MDKIGLFFGSFNPIHIGHLIIANLVHQTEFIDEIWFVITPQNPLKKSSNLIHTFDRIDLLNAAISEHYRFKVCDIELKLPKPNYTVDTLTYLQEKYPEKEFFLIIGQDNLAQFPKWKNHKIILKNHKLIVYPRPNSSKSDLEKHDSVTFIDAPLIDISATFIRKLIKSNKSIKYLVHPNVEELIHSRNLFL